MNEIKSLSVRLSDRGKVCSRIIHRLLQEQHVNINALKRTCSSPLPRPMCIFGSGYQFDGSFHSTSRTCSRSFSSANQTSPSWIVLCNSILRSAIFAMACVVFVGKLMMERNSFCLCLCCCCCFFCLLLCL